MLTIREERMSGAMTKYHVGGLRRSVVFHRFEDIDRGDCHDHPFSLDIKIISGGYIERIWNRDGRSWEYRREPGDSFIIPATHIHLMIELLDGPCETMIMPGPWERKSGFWQFRQDGSYFREWDQPEFRRVST